MLLPHGYDGQGPEHSSARLERFLQLCAENNLLVCYPSTPAQYFHLLRRQVRGPYRRPLIAMTPKSMLRHKLVVSPISDFTENTSFQGILDDPAADKVANRIILCSGKVYWDLIEQRAKESKPVAIVRLEQLYPFPAELLRRTLDRYPRAHSDVVWVQEESHNMGAWSFVEPRLRAMGLNVKYVGRDDSASPATGSLEIHKREQRELVQAAYQAEASHLVCSHAVGTPLTQPGKNGSNGDGRETEEEVAKAKA
jgi:2-oxoglutarate dehydrogenase E1 component